MDALRAIDALDDLVHAGRQVPLSDRVRVDRDRWAELTQTLEAQLAGIRDAPAVAAALGRLLAQAPTGDGRRGSVDKAEVYDALDALRAAIPDALRTARGAPSSPWTPEQQAVLTAVDAVDDLVRDAKRAFLRDRCRADAATAGAAVDDLRDAAVRALAFQAPSDQVERVRAALGGPARGAQGRVSFDREDAYDALDQLRMQLSDLVRPAA